MAKTIVSIQEVIDLNHLLEEKEMAFKIHLHDACGAQSLSVEALSEELSQEQQQSVKAEITAYFEGRGIEILFAQNQRDFYIM